MRSYPVKENHIGSVVSEILRFNTQTQILLLYSKDINYVIVIILTYIYTYWILVILYQSSHD